MDFAEIKELLLTRLEVSEVKVKFLVGELTFKREEVLSASKAEAEIEDALTRFFLRKDVLRVDLSAELYDEVTASLDALVRGLDEKAAALKAVPRPGPERLALARAFTSWASATLSAKKALDRRCQDIADEKASTPGYDSSNEDRQAALGDAVLDLRKNTAPLIFALIEMLPDTNCKKQECQDAWDRANRYVRDESTKRRLTPSWRVT
jgi:hypothetical protein